MDKKVISINTLRNAKIIRKQSNARIEANHRNRKLLEEAIGELNHQTGIDFLKVFSGDSRENQKLNLKRYQDALKL